MTLFSFSMFFLSCCSQRFGPRLFGFTISPMANLMLVYGMRLLPSDEIAEIGEAIIKLKNGREARVTMHVLEGGKEEIEAQLRQSVDAFFSFYPEI